MKYSTHYYLILGIYFSLISNAICQSSYSLEFDGNDDTIDLGYVSGFDPTGDVTIEAWVKPYSLPVSGNYIFSLGGNGHLALGYGSDSSFGFTPVLSGNTQYGISSDPIYPPNEWYHVVGIYDNSNNIGYLYVNGEMVASLNTPDEDFYTPNSSNSNIGSYYEPFYGREFHGAISSVHLTQDIKYSANFYPETTFKPTSHTIGLWLMDEGSGNLAYDNVKTHDGTINGPIWITDVPAVDTESYIPTDGLVGWWPFNGNANDESGNGNNGTVNGATLTTDRFGNPNSAYDFDGQDDYISCVNNLAGNYTAFSVSTWVNVASYPDIDFGKIIDIGGGAGNNGRIQLASSFLDGFEYSVSEADILNDGLAEITNYGVTNQWTHIVGTWNGTNFINLYINGIEVNSNFIAPTISSLLIDNLGLLIIGRRYNNTDYFHGQIDDIGIWNRALTLEEVSKLYYGNIPSYVPYSSLDSWWPFNGNANDESGNGNNGTVNGATLTTDRFGNPNSAYSFDGINDNIELLNRYFGGASNVSEFTFSYWFFLDQLPPGPAPNNFYGIMHFDSYWRQKFTGVDNVGVLSWGGAEPDPQAYFGLSSATNAIAANRWYNITVVYKDSALNLYVDGMLNLTQNISQSTLDFSKVVLGNSNGKNLFGSRTSVSEGDYAFFNGKIDDIGAWQRALSDCEIQELFYSQPNPIDNTVSLNGNIITVNQEGATYQWLDCNNGNGPIEGENNREFYPSMSGNYSVEINLNGCISFSDCIVYESLDVSSEVINSLAIYPNPFNNLLSIKSESRIKKVEFFSIQGTKVKETLSDFNVIPTTNLSEGLYLVKIYSDKGTIIKKLIKN